MPEMTIVAFANKHNERAMKIREYARKQGFPAYRLGKRWFVSESEGLAWLQKFRAESGRRQQKGKRTEDDTATRDAFWNLPPVGTWLYYLTRDSIGAYEAFSIIRAYGWASDAEDEKPVDIVVQQLHRQEPHTLTVRKFQTLLRTGELKIVAPDEVRRRLHKQLTQPEVWASLEELVSQDEFEATRALCETLRTHLRLMGDTRWGKQIALHPHTGAVKLRGGQTKGPV